MINISLISRHGTSARKMAFSYPLSDYLTTHRPVNNYNKLKILQVGSDLLRRKWQVTILTFKIYVAAWPSSHTQLWIMPTIRTLRTTCATLTLGLVTGPWAWSMRYIFLYLQTLYYENTGWQFSCSMAFPQWATERVAVRVFISFLSHRSKKSLNQRLTIQWCSCGVAAMLVPYYYSLSVVMRIWVLSNPPAMLSS